MCTFLYVDKGGWGYFFDARGWDASLCEKLVCVAMVKMVENLALLCFSKMKSPGFTNEKRSKFIVLLVR